jgi:hypothetical protein
MRSQHCSTLLHPLEGWRRPSEAILAALRGVFTTDTEDGEIACVLHLKIPNVPTRGATQARGRFVRIGRRRRCGSYPPSPRPSEGIFVPLIWVHLYVYLDNARYTEGISILYKSGEE